MKTQVDAVKNLYLEWAAARNANPQMSLDEQRDMIEGWPIIAAEPRGVDYIEIEVGGLPALWAVPKGCAQDRVVLCVHGGGFVTGSMYSHRKFYGQLAKAIGCRALIPDYRRSPEHPFPAALDDVVAAYRWLLDQGLKANHIALAGDSSGGGLVIASQLQARDAGLPMPAAALPISPWLDMAVTGESIVSNFGKDALFTKEMIQGLARALLGDADPRDPFASPLYADLSGLAPTYIQVGGDEMIRDDGVRFTERAKEAGVEVRLDVFPGQQHTFQMAAGRAVLADEAIRQMADWVRPKLGLTGAARERKDH